MTTPRYARIHNDCPKRVTIRLRIPKPKRKSKTPPASFVLKPQESSNALPLHFLVGAPGWEQLQTKPCVRIEEVEYEPRFVQILNQSDRLVTLRVRAATRKAPKGAKAITLKPQRARIVDYDSIQRKGDLGKLSGAGVVTVQPVLELGPSTGRGGSVASFVDEDVYICYECGGPIVFRGSPPAPVHI